MDGRVAMVTGGGAGIGRAAALMLAREGADIVVCDLNAGTGKAVAEEVEALGRRAIAIPTDSSDPDQVARLVEEAIRRLGKIDILVNNAGIVTTDTILALTPETWDRVVAVHLKSMFVCSQAVIRDMSGRDWGRIVNITSRAAYRGRAGVGPYSAAKGGMLAYSRVLAAETAQWGITVNNVAPGTTLTPMVERAFPTTDGQAQEARSSGVITAPVRLAEADEIAGAVLYLCGPLSGHTTGTTIHVNGGSFMP
ncbi:beta-ketoacyl-ACP reductase [Phytohabitans suffuscus]|uniref:Beta-ketoacyl-ACP reductase n=2 Tax=Phytohabitans suffuscus TaxID=624315 RepID=A0A6F8YCC0_9ACTN|nr:beta-ketoacyl-ACP reductase [Phytohabitans suffuscus]